MSRTLLALLAVAGFSVGGASFVAAEDKEHATPAGEHAAKPISGVVVSYADNKLVIKGKKEEHTIKTDDKTEVVINGEKKALADLKADMKVKVTVEKEVATKIESGKAPKKEH